MGNKEFYFSDGSGTHPNTGFRKCHGEMGLRKVEQGFSSFFCQISGIFEDVLMWSMPKAL